MIPPGQSAAAAQSTNRTSGAALEGRISWARPQFGRSRRSSFFRCLNLRRGVPRLGGRGWCSPHATRTTIAVALGKGVGSMYDYSLHDVAVRPATVGDKLVTTQFANSITRGFAAVGEPNVAMCLLPGTEVAFEKDKDIEFERGLGFFLNCKRAKRTGERVARFRQVHTDKPHVHHDALEFPNGEFVPHSPLRGAIRDSIAVARRVARCRLFRAREDCCCGGDGPAYGRDTLN
jgi:hypothetical protein